MASQIQRGTEPDVVPSLSEGRGHHPIPALARQLARNPLSLLGTLIVVMFLLLAVFGPTLAPYQYDDVIRGAARQAPSAQYLFGTDRLGRDVFSRVLWGAREIITLPMLTTTL